MQTELGVVWAQDFSPVQVRDMISRAVVRADAMYMLAREEDETAVRLRLIADAGDFRTMAQAMAKVIGDPPPQSLTEAWVTLPRNPLILSVQA